MAAGLGRDGKTSVQFLIAVSSQSCPLPVFSGMCGRSSLVWDPLMLEMCLNPSGGTGDWGSGKPYSKTGYARANTAGFLLDGSSLVGDRRRGKWARKCSTYGGLTLVGPPSVLNGQSPSQAQVRATNTSLTRKLRLLQVPLVSVSTKNRPTRPLPGAAGPYAWRPKGGRSQTIPPPQDPLHGLRAQRPTTTIPSSAPHSFRQSTTLCSDCPIAQRTRWRPNLPTCQGDYGSTR